MADEHISIRLGLDKRDFERGLQSTKDIFGGLGKALAGIGIGVGIGEITHKLIELGFGALETAERLKTQAEALEVTTDFLQRFTTYAGQNGSSVETASKALDHFTRNLKENGDTGEGVEKQFRDLMDKIKGTISPVDRATLVFKNLGKGTSDLIPLLSQGASGFDAVTASINRLTESQIEKLDKIKSKWEEITNNIKINSAVTLSNIGKVAEAWDRARAIQKEQPGLSMAAAAGIAAKEIAAREVEAAAATEKRREDAKAAGIEAAAQERALKSEGEYLKIQDAQVKLDKEAALLKQQQADAAERILDASAKLSGLTGPGGANDQAKHDLSGSTLGDIAGSRAFTRQGAQNIRAAQAAMNAEAFAKQARIQGRPDLADKATDYALGIRKRLGALTGAEQNPLAGVQENTKMAAEHLQTLLDKFSDGSAVVTAQGGE